MLTLLRWTGTVLFSLIGVFLVLFGVLYATVGDYLPFHAAAVEQSAREPGKALYIALMTLIGGASSMLGVLGLYVTWGPVRDGSRLAALFVSVSYIGAFLAAAMTAERLAEATNAPTSWHIMGILIVITVAGLTCARVGARDGGRS